VREALGGSFSFINRREGEPHQMQTPQFFPLGEGLELTQIERQEGQLVLHVTATSLSALCPLCHQPATRLHSRYRRVVKDLPCAGQQVRLILHVRKFFCETVECVRKVFAERLPHLVAPWAQMTTRLSESLQTIGLATCGKLGARLAKHLGIITSWMTIVRRIMALPSPQAEHVECLGLDDFSFRRGRTFGTVVVDLDAHQIIDLLPDRQADTAAAWMAAHPEITHVSRDRGAEYASAASTGAPQAIQVADRYHICHNLSEAVQRLLARVLAEMKTASHEADGKAQTHEETAVSAGQSHLNMEEVIE
jgi:transposase